jgi:hypothetical protein
MKRALIVALLVVACGGNAAPTPTPTGGVSSTATALPSADACHHDGAVYCLLNSAVTQATIKTTICVSGWTATVRPSSSYTSKLKAEQLATYAYLHPGDPMWNAAGTEEDHRLPLELGGHPSDPLNLSPEEHPGSFTKDAAENKAHSDVCNGRLTLAEAQRVFVLTYLGPYPGYIFPA